MSFNVNVNNRVRVQNLWLDDQQQRDLGQFAIETMQKRIRGGINLGDQPASRLSVPYERRKLRRGLSGLRNLTFTGAMLNNMSVLDVGRSIKIGFPDPRQALKAGVNQGREKMIGLSRFDQRAVIEKHDEHMVRTILFIEVVAA